MARGAFNSYAGDMPDLPAMFPMLLLLYLGTGMALAVGLVIWLADAALVRLGVRRFRREALLARL